MRQSTHSCNSPDREDSPYFLIDFLMMIPYLIYLLKYLKCILIITFITLSNTFSIISQKDINFQIRVSVYYFQCVVFDLFAAFHLKLQHYTIEIYFIEFSFPLFFVTFVHNIFSDLKREDELLEMLSLSTFKSFKIARSTMYKSVNPI